MSRKKAIDELAEEILRDFDAGDTPAARAQSALQQARDAGDGSLRQDHLRAAQAHIAEIDPRANAKLVQQLQAEVLALQGRGGDTRIAHVTPNEVVLPRWAQTPELMRALAAVARSRGIDPATLRVGSGKNRINPRPGQMEFDDGLSQDGFNQMPRWNQWDADQFGSGSLLNPTYINYLDAQSIASPTTADVSSNVAGTGPGASPETYGPSWPTDRDKEIGRRARVIYGETSGVYPQTGNNGADSATPSSAQKLEQAREDIAIVSSRNPRVHSAEPTNFQDPAQARAWDNSVQASTNSMNSTLDPRINRFYLRQAGSDQEIPTYTPLIPPLGPFNNVGGGDVPKGPATYIDFYTDQKRK